MSSVDQLNFDDPLLLFGYVDGENTIIGQRRIDVFLLAVLRDAEGPMEGSYSGLLRARSHLHASFDGKFLIILKDFDFPGYEL